MFKKWFSRTPELPAADLSVLHCDFHSHLIPGIDDGAETIEDSLKLIESLMEFGYKKIITTPHTMDDYYRNTPEVILSGLKTVQDAVKEKGWDVTIEASSEYYLDAGFEELMKEDKLLPFGDNYILFEMGFMAEPHSLNSIVFNLLTAGYKPILAHPERYPFWHNEFEKYEAMHDKGVILQLNITSLSGQYSPQVKSIAERLIDQNLIGALGSDCHNEFHIERIKASLKNPHLHKVLEADLINKTL